MQPTLGNASVAKQVSFFRCDLMRECVPEAPLGSFKPPGSSYNASKASFKTGSLLYDKSLRAKRALHGTQAFETAARLCRTIKQD